MKLVRADDVVEMMKRFGFRSDFISIESAIIDEVDAAESVNRTVQMNLPPDKAFESLKWQMPIFNRMCMNCGAMCFDDDSYCAECGSKFETCLT